MEICAQRNRLNLEISAETGEIQASIVDGLRSEDIRKKSGLRITDAATGIESAVALPMVESDGNYCQTGVINGIQVNVTYKATDDGLFISGTLNNQGQDDRLVCVKYRIPIQSPGLRWLNDSEDSCLIQTCKTYTNSTVMVPGQLEQTVSLYPFGGVSNGKQTLAMAIPLDPPSSFEISYECWNWVGYLVVTVRMALTPKTELIPNVGKFSFAVYTPSYPEWGFRAITQGYYERFPQYYEKRIDGGNWLFQHNYAELENIEDYGFRYNETPGPFKTDWDNNIVPLRYTAPGEVWMYWVERPRDPHPTYEEFMQHFEELQSDETPHPEFYKVLNKEFAEAVANSAVHTKEHKYLTMGWHAYGPTVAFFTNHSPSIPGWNLYKLQKQQVQCHLDRAEQEGSSLGGIYIDNLSWGYDTPYNYRIDHFKYSAYNLLWDDGKELVWPNHFAQYEYAKAIREQTLAENKIVLANSVFPEKGAVHYAHLVDVAGSEVGPDWGHDLWIQRLRRALVYRKPWALLYTNEFHLDSNKESELYAFKNHNIYAYKEQVMKNALLYGNFANVIGYRVPMEEYHEVRPLFKKYVPSMQCADRLGWEPITHAVTDRSELLMERYGDMSQNEMLFTVMNTASDTVNGSIAVDYRTIGITDEKASALTVTDMLGDSPVSVSLNGDKLIIDLSIAGGAVASVLLS